MAVPPAPPMVIVELLLPIPAKAPEALLRMCDESDKDDEKTVDDELAAAAAACPRRAPSVE